MITPSVITVSPRVKSVVASPVPANVTIAPLNVAAVVVPDLRIRLPLLFVAEPNVVPPSLKKTSPPSASRVISPAASIANVDTPPSVLLMVNTSTMLPPTATPHRHSQSSDVALALISFTVIRATSVLFDDASSM